MYKVINEYLSKVNLQSDNVIYSLLTSYLDSVTTIRKSTVTVNFNRYIVDIRLNEFSIDKATEIFNDFNKAVSYPYSSMYVRFNEGSCVRYRYITCRENKDGFYCDIIIS